MTLFLSLFYVKFENLIHNFQYSPPGYTKLSSLIGKTSDLVVDRGRNDTVEKEIN